MCGIFYLQATKEDKSVYETLQRIKHRGPDTTTIISNSTDKETMAFHRLAINGASGLANQPMTLDGEAYLLCNGEIYNHEALQKKYNVQCATGSDCEIILHLFAKIGFEQTVKELNGEFALIIVTPDYVYAARDPYGVRALYIAGGKSIGIASECKALNPLFKSDTIAQFSPGYSMAWNKTEKKIDYMKPYYTYKNLINRDIIANTPAEGECIKNVRELLIGAVKKRMMCSRTTTDNNDIPAIGAYLSGGFDSSIIASILQKELSSSLVPCKLETFSIGFLNSPDLRYARQVADFIGSNHHEVIITEEEALAAIPDVIKAIESYDITTVRASTMMYLLSKYIKENSKVVVLLSGEGSDEASGSYKYFHNAPSDEEFHKESERLLKDLCYFDNLRADKSSAAWGLEVRVPFLDLDFLKYYMTVPRQIKTQKGIEKYLLRQAFTDNYLPEEVLWRPKEAMSDGVSLLERSWSTIIQERAKRLLNYIRDGLEAEKALYLLYFNKHYKGCEKQIPYMWLPKWCGDVKDPSARVLSIYKGVASLSNPA
jgi:asparagine synthase (glutamine-hydrolysing)